MQPHSNPHEENPNLEINVNGHLNGHAQAVPVHDETELAVEAVASENVAVSEDEVSELSDAELSGVGIEVEFSPEEQSELHVAEGDLKGDDGDFIGALAEYKKAANLQPESARHLSRLAEGYAAADQPFKAIEYYQRALHARKETDGDQDLPEAHIGLGDLCHSFAYSAAAVRSYERAVRSRPRHAFYRWKLAVALATLGLYDKAEKQLLAALDISPQDAFYHFQLADVYLLMHHDTNAINEFTRTVELAPFDDYYRLRLGAALLRAERTQEAVSQFERAVELKPENPSYRTLLRYAYSRNEQEPAIAVDIELLELEPYDEDFVRRFQKLSQPVS